VLRVWLSVAILGASFAGASGGAAPAWATGASPYFSALPASGETEFHTARFHAVASPLPNGQVLIAGGEVGSTVLRSAELFNPATDTFTALPEAGETELHVAREGAVAALLPGGQVLIAGGSNGSAVLRSAELFDPATDTFTALPESGETELQTARGRAVAAPLPSGQVLITGGDGELLPPRSAELFNPTTDTFTALAESGSTQPHTQRVAAVTAQLPSGQVLIAGGANGHGYTESAELFDQATDAFTALPESGETEMHTARYAAMAAPLPSGQVLIAGGSGEPPLKSAEVFNPATDTFSALPESGETELQTARTGAVAAPLPGGQVLIAGGGEAGGGGTLRSAELFDGAPEVAVAGGGFGDQTVGESSADQLLIVTNVGAQALVISGASTGGANAGDFTIVSDACALRKLELWQSCTITTRFTPAATGAREATIALSDNETSPTNVVLSGTGVAANSGPAGPIGPTGPIGDTGTTGAAGTNGTTGATGAQGPAGPQGAAGPRGPAGQIELVTCKSITTAKGKKTVQKCKTKLTSSPVTITTAGASLTALLSRGTVVFATGSATRSGNQTKLLMTTRRHIGKGSYTLTLTRGRERQRETITIA